MKKIIFFLFIVLLNAKIVTNCLNVTGNGSNKNEAIKDALILAVSQYKGISIKQVEFLQNKINNISINDKDVSVMQNNYANKIVATTGGFIKNFRIINSENEGGNYKVTIKVCFNEYKNTGNPPSKRKTIAVLPFLEDKNLVFTKYVVEDLTQVRKFNVIDRVDEKYLNLENLFWLKPTTDKNELIKLGKRIGSDYILIGKLNIKKNIKYEKMPLLDKYQKKEQFTLNADFKILDSVTGVVKWADSVKISGNDLNDVYTRAAKKIIEKIIYNIYPPRIINVEGKYITINYGANFFKKGDVLSIYTAKKALYDTYTKEFLGYEERKAGIAKIIRITPKFSIAVYKGEARKGYILRKVGK